MKPAGPNNQMKAAPFLNYLKNIEGFPGVCYGSAVAQTTEQAWHCLGNNDAMEAGASFPEGYAHRRLVVSSAHPA